jgi:hypothetical protein
MASYVTYIKYVPEKEINLITIRHRTAPTRGKTWRTGWPGYSPPTRTPRRPRRSATRGWRATPQPTDLRDPWSLPRVRPTWEASTGGATPDRTDRTTRRTGETSFAYFTFSLCSNLVPLPSRSGTVPDTNLSSLQDQRQSPVDSVQIIFLAYLIVRHCF